VERALKGCKKERECVFIYARKKIKKGKDKRVLSFLVKLN